MANKFTMTFTAIDKATAVVRGINKRIAEVTSPVTRVKASWKDFGKELGKNQVVQGANKLTAAFGKTAKAASRFVPELGDLVGTTEAIAGVGGAIGVVGGVAVAAVAAIGMLAVKYGKLGFNVKQTSLTLGESAQAVQAWRGAAGRWGIDVASVDGAMQSLGDTIQDATMGRNQSALMFMNRLHITLKRTKTGAVDTADEMLQLADAIHKFDGQPQVQSLIARQFGVESMLPALRGGRAQLQAYLKDQAKYAISDKQIEDANRFNMALNQGVQIAKGFGFKAMAWEFDTQAKYWNGILHPLQAISKLWKGGSGLVSNLWKGGSHIAADVLKGLGDDLKGFFTGLWNDVVAMFTAGIQRVKAIADAARALPGQAGAAAAKAGANVGAAIHGGLEGIGHFFGKMDVGKGKSIQAFFQAQGYSKPQAAGITAGMQAESRLNEHARNPTSGAYGIGQWLGKRQKDFAQLFGHPLQKSTLDEQLRFMAWEMKNTEAKAGGAIAGQTTGQGALDAYVRKYMRPAPGGETSGDIGRGQSALLDLLAKPDTAPANGVRPGALASAAPAGKVSVDVNVRHDGRAATVKTSSAGAVSARGRVQRSMDAIPA